MDLLKPVLRMVGGAALLLGCSDGCVFPEFPADPMRLEITRPDGERICTRGVIVTTDVDAALEAASSGSFDSRDFATLEVVTYNNLDRQGREIEGMENLCEHRVHRWFKDGGAPEVLVLFQPEEGTVWVSERISFPVRLDECGDAQPASLELELRLP